jgi:hypothetical protein
MGDNVWIQWFVRAATSLFNPSASSSSQKNPNSGGASPNVPVSAVASTSISTSATNLVVTRNLKKTTPNAVFGDLTFKGNWICYTMENAADLVLPGTYSAQLDKSPHLGYVCPHLRVPDRDALAGGDAGIRLHVANFASQIRGCVALGLEIGPDCLNHSQAAFDKMMAVLPQEFSVEITEI